MTALPPAELFEQVVALLEGPIERSVPVSTARPEVRGRYRGYAARIALVPEPTGRTSSQTVLVASPSGPSFLEIALTGPTRGARMFGTPPAQSGPRMLTGDPAFEADYDPYGAPELVARELLTPPVRSTLLAYPRATFAMERDQVLMGLWGDARTVDDVHSKLEIMAGWLDDLPHAIERAGFADQLVDGSLPEAPNPGRWIALAVAAALVVFVVIPSICVAAGGVFFALR